MMKKAKIKANIDLFLALAQLVAWLLGKRKEKKE